VIVYLRKLSVPAFTLPGMEPTTNVSGWVDQLDDMAVRVTDALLREGAGVQPPTVHVLVDELDQPYVGYVRCRPFYRGRDAHAAVGAMGLFASQLGASRVVVTYEHADMALGWEDPDAGEAPTGIVVVDAARDEHTVRWHPMVMTLATAISPSDVGPGAAGAPAVEACWGPPDRYPGGELPAAVAQLLAVWREPRACSEPEFLAVYARWQESGYDVRWAPRPDGERRQPGWMRLLAPVM
jgi:hypothetical protein